MSGKITRRRFLSSTAVSLLGAGLLPAQTRSASGTKRVLHLFMAGGMSHIDTFDPKPGIRTIPTNVDGIFISEHLPRLAKMMDQIAIIRSMSHGDKSHAAAQHAFRIDQPVSINTKDTYEADRVFERDLAHACCLLQNGSRYVEVELGGWDTHTENETRVAKQCAILDHTLSSLLLAGETNAVLAETLIVVSTEFGRSAKINGFGGREHHPAAFTCLMAGSGVRGGQVIGSTSEDGMKVIGNITSPADLQASILTALGSTSHSMAGASRGIPIPALFN